MLLSVLGSGPALAADFPLPAGEPARVPAIYDANGPYTNWAGVYLGLNGGYGLGSSQWTLGLLGTDVFNTSGSLFGGTAGFNFPISAVLVGLEGDVDWSGLSGSAANCAVMQAAPWRLVRPRATCSERRALASVMHSIGR
jgi:outer membrane immunogenic protein